MPITFAPVTMTAEIQTYNNNQTAIDQEICNLLATTIDQLLPQAESKIWHAHPVWFLAGNPIVGYSKQKPGWRLMFWSGASFEDEKLNIVGKKFKDASLFYTNATQIVKEDLEKWLEQAKAIQWDYKNIIKNKGQLNRLIFEK